MPQTKPTRYQFRLTLQELGWNRETNLVRVVIINVRRRGVDGRGIFNVLIQRAKNYGAKDVHCEIPTVGTACVQHTRVVQHAVRR